MSGSQDEFKEGEQVGWNYAGREVKGTVVEKATHDEQIKSHHVKASEKDPRYIVESNKTGAKAGHKPEALHHVQD